MDFVSEINFYGFKENLSLKWCNGFIGMIVKNGMN